MAKEDVLVSSENSYGIVAFMFGILSIFLSPGLDIFVFYGPVVGLTLGILGIIFAVKQRTIAKNKWANWGLWLSIIGIVISIAILVSLIKFIIPTILPKLAEIEQQLRASITA